MKKVKQKPYIIGLDLGTNSVGWSVMCNNYKVPSRTMPVLGNTSKETITKNMMGVVLFDSGNDASQRRLSRGASRRYDRKRRRVFYLQDIFKDVMEEVDENFFQRLDESFLTPEDKTHEKYTIFGTSAEEKAYQKRFPTIYHLREYVANTNEKVDIRLVYLVLAHMIKNRGHFLIDDPNFQVTNNDPLSLLNEMIEEYNEVEDESISLAPTEVSDVLKATLKKTDKTEKVLSYLPDVKKKNLLEALISLAVGRLVNFKTVFKLEEDASLQVSKETFETDLNALISLIGEEYEEVFLLAKKVNSSILLADVLSEGDTKSPLSTKMVQRYDKHKEDLGLLKKVVKEVAPESYNDVFRKDEKDGYAAYIGLNKKHRKRKTAAASEQAFYTYIKKLLKDDPRAKEVLNEIEKEDFLRKQRTFDNGSIPYQVHLAEMKAVLASQGQYYPFLKENADKIQQILSFRIPYYVGPLAKGYSDYAWVERNSDEAIRPWNFDQVVNKEKSAEKFIEQLTSYDLNLPNEKVLPKNSILYQTFGVFNELTKIQFVAEGMTNYAFLTGAQKKDIFERFFKQNKGGKVTKKDLIKYLENNHGYRVLEIKGIESQFNAKFSTYHDLNQIIQDKAYLDNEDNQEILERIVHALTVFNDREMVLTTLSKMNTGLDDAVLEKLSRKHYTGWGNFSAKLIDGIRDKDSYKTILDYLKEDDLNNRNYMQLIHSPYLSFGKTIEEAKQINEIDDIVAVVQGLAGSPKNKKGIIQSIKVVKELVKVMGYEPDSIVIEWARENQTTKAGKKKSVSRYDKLKEPLEALAKQKKDSLLNIHNLDNAALQNEKIYLYCLQNGKDMYTGKPLDFDRLEYYDVDHIIPRAFIKDDSIENKVLTSSKLNRGKSADVPSIEVVEKMKSYWRILLNQELISKKKFNNLIKAESGGLSDKDKAGFIKRQLVEKRQITKNVAQILNEMFNHEAANTNKKKNVKIITLKSKMASDFRKINGLHKNRDLNDYHYAHDAYLNAVVATALLKKYPKLQQEFVYGEYQKYSLRKLFSQNKEKSEHGKATEKYFFYSNLMNMFKDKITNAAGEEIELDVIERCPDTGLIAWDKEKDKKAVMKHFCSPQVNVVKKVEEQKVGLNGGLFDSNLKSTLFVSPDKLIPIKKGLDTRKYGGYQRLTTAYSVLLIQDNHDNILIPIYLIDKKEFEKFPETYLKEKGYLKENEYQIIKLPKYSLFDTGKGRRLLASSKQFQQANQLVVSKGSQDLLYFSSKFDKAEGKEYFKVNRAKGFDKLFEELIVFIDKNQIGSRLEELKELYKKNKDKASNEELAKNFVELLKYTKYGALDQKGIVFFGKQFPYTRYKSKKDLNSCINGVLIYQSITGLYETRVNLKKE